MSDFRLVPEGTKKLGTWFSFTRGSAAQISANHVVKKKVLKKVLIFLKSFLSFKF
jgi:hypothetical protein